MSIVYCFRQNIDEDSGEYHIRKINEMSECGELLYAYAEEDVHHNPITGRFQVYFPEKDMRFACANLGKCVCGQCVATLYTTK